MPEKQRIACSDDQLLALLQQDSRDAFDQLYERYWEQLFTFVTNVVGDRDEAKDIVQEVFITLWCRRAKTNGILSLNAYLFSIAKYNSIRYIRKTLHENSCLDSLKLFLDKEGDPVSREIEVNELSLLINKEVEQLPSKMKEVFTLSRDQHLSHKLISEKLTISDKTVKKQINNVLKHLRLKLADFL